ncbi:MAG: response regulator [Sulfobacillus acidophilus]|uniref:Stage 0 sporulation protein A homolog n=1 Tax=Sulfobacillus acidophilus TaxID=53633 RepID=A0A2T2WLN2_9FIRM|nr:MAG: response regulator [Sulfobacillus acidophilus]
MVATVLVIDDEWGIRDIVKLALGQIGVDVIEADSAQVALEILSRSELDVVITDIRLPDMNGLDLARNIRQSYPALPTIFMSAATSGLFLASSQPEQIWLEKPFKIQDLQTVVQEVLDWTRHAAEPMS